MRIIGIGVCGGGEADKYLEETLKEFKRLCDDTIIVTNNGTQKEFDLIEKYGFWTYEDNREWGVHQPHIKTDLLTKASKLRPDWIVALDMDEKFAPEFTRQEAERLASGEEIAYYFMVVNLYNDTEHFAHSIGIQRFWNIRFFKHLPGYGYEYQKKSLHCGLAPPLFYKYGWHAPYYLEHFGLMRKEDRDRRVARYQQYDPKAKFKGREYYNDLGAELKMIPFNREKLLKQLSEAKETQKRITPKMQ